MLMYVSKYRQQLLAERLSEATTTMQLIEEAPSKAWSNFDTRQRLMFPNSKLTNVGAYPLFTTTTLLAQAWGGTQH